MPLRERTILKSLYDANKNERILEKQTHKIVANLLSPKSLSKPTEDAPKVVK